MFGLTEQELDNYRSLAQDFAVQDLSPSVVTAAQIMTPATQENGETVPDMEFIEKLVTDIETVATLTVSHMAYDYAHLQSDINLSEDEIVEKLENKYETYVINQFIKYGIVSSSDAASDIVIQTLLELPYLYSRAVEDDSFDEDSFLEERLEAYNSYIEKYYGDAKEEEDDD
ncbi:hypothetical protein SP3_00172 [Bacillus phage fHSPT3]|nr:hypothetical protein TIMEGRIFFIN_31 [Bacillus phage vB_BspH_TimeGriffin]